MNGLIKASYLYSLARCAAFMKVLLLEDCALLVHPASLTCSSAIHLVSLRKMAP